MASDPVSNPRAHAGPAEPCGTSVHKALGGPMIEVFRGYALQERDVIRDARNMWEQVRYPRGAVPVLLEGMAGAEQLWFLLREGVHEGEPLPRHERVGNRLVVVLLQRRLEIEELELAGPARHEKVDDVFRLGREVSGLGLHGIGRGLFREDAAIAQQR